MLEAYDGTLSEPTAIREAAYTNLGPGSYRFRVIASNSDGRWNGGEAIQSFQIEPLFWQTWSFRAGMILLTATAVFGFYRFRVQRIAKALDFRFQGKLAERTRIAQELHDTLLQGFLSASMQIDAATCSLPESSTAKPILTQALADGCVKSSKRAETPFVVFAFHGRLLRS